MRYNVIKCIVCCLVGLCVYLSTENSTRGAERDGQALLVSPLAGWHENTLKSMVNGPNGMSEVSSTDTAPEYDLFTLFAHPCFVVNNTFFYSSDPNDADITGDFVFVNLYASADEELRWNIGGGCLWHDIALDNDMDISISMPLVKVGAVAEWPMPGITCNPYIGYAWEKVETPYGDEDTQSMLYGITVKCYWRMMHMSLKYYLQDNLDTDEQYNVLKARAFFFFDETWGVVARGEYSEHSQTEDTSLLIGPAFIL